MKFFILSFFIAQVSFAANLPQSWVNETSFKSLSTPTKDLADTQNYLDSVLGVQEKVLTGREDKLQNGFKFSQYVTDFSVSKSGLFGLSSMKATTAVEVKWKKNTPVALDGPIELEVVDDSDEGLSITASQVEALAMSSGKVKASEELKDNIRKVLEQSKTMMDQMDHMDFPGWKLDALRLDLSIGANGRVWTFAKAGASVRVRLDWKKVKKTFKPKSLVSNNSAKFINKVLYDFNEIYKEQDLFGFKVKIVNVGIGLSRKSGFLGLSSTKMGFVGYLRFVPIPVVQKSNLPMIEDQASLATEDMEYLDEEEVEVKSLKSFTIPRKKWRAGLVKGLEMAKFFAGVAGRFQNNWQVTEIKTVFELSRSGFLGLASTTANGVIETELVRK